MRILGPNTLVQAALPAMLEDTPQEFHQRNIAVFEVRGNRTVFLPNVGVSQCGCLCVQENARLVYEGLRDVPGLNPVMPSGAMYMMVSHVPLV